MRDLIVNVPDARRRTVRAACLLVLTCCAHAAAGLPALDSVMDRDPRLPVQAVEHHVPAEWRALWQRGLDGPEEDLRREVAEAVIRAHQSGCRDLDEFSASLRRALATSKNATVRLSLATALIELDAVDAAAELAALVESGGDRESLVIEPALARWKYPPMSEVWRTRLAEPQNTSQRRLLLAIDAVRVINESRAQSALRELVLDRAQPAAVRLPAAAALGVVRTTDLVSDAQQLAADTSPRGVVDRLAAVSMLGSDRTETVQQLLATLSVDPQSAVAAVALDKLLAIDPALVQPLAPVLLDRSEGQLRQLAARSLFERPAIEHVATLSRLLDDPHRDVRVAAREHLHDLAKQPDLRQPVIDGATPILESGSWHGLEQSARLLGELDHQPVAPRLLVLLQHERPEVHITAAWSLCRLAPPDALPGMLAFAEQVTAGIPADPEEAHDVSLTPAQDVSLSHLFQAFGVMKYAAAEPLLLKFVPRRYDLGPQSRAAACWALGLLHADDPQPDLVRLLGQRAADSGDFPVLEPVIVRAKAAVSLGRINASEAVQVLRSIYSSGSPGDPIRESCGWALEQITGENLPDPDVRRVVPFAPFLQPLNPSPSP